MVNQCRRRMTTRGRPARRIAKLGSFGKSPPIPSGLVKATHEVHSLHMTSGWSSDLDMAGEPDHVVAAQQRLQSPAALVKRLLAEILAVEPDALMVLPFLC
jgi:hypothetical protein